MRGPAFAERPGVMSNNLMNIPVVIVDKNFTKVL